MQMFPVAAEKTLDSERAIAVGQLMNRRCLG